MAILKISNKVYDVPDGAYKGIITDIDLQYSEGADEKAEELTIEKVVLTIESALNDGFVFCNKSYYYAVISKSSRLGKLLHDLDYDLKPDEDFDIDQIIGLKITFDVVHNGEYCNIENVKRI